MAKDLIAISLTHRRAPVEVRERMAFTTTEVAQALGELRSGITREALLISTCNRTELYALPGDENISGDFLIDFLLTHKSIPSHDHGTLRPYFDHHSYCEAITHLFEVIAGIDSQVVGDQQIFAQVKDSFRVATESDSSGGVMAKLAHAAFRVAKRVRTETSIATGAATISYASVEFARKVYEDLKGRVALVIGAGDTAELSAKHLVERGIGTLIIANRTETTAREMLLRVRESDPRPNDRAIGLDELPSALKKADIVISSTSAPGFVLTPSIVEPAVRGRSSSGPIVLIDIALPRDIDPAVGKLPNIFLKDIDDLRSIVDQNLARRMAEIPKVKAIIAEELANFLALQTKLEVGPTIKELRDRFEAIRREELDRNLRKLDDPSRAVVEEMTRRMMNRLLHAPTIMLKEPRASLDDILTRIELIRELFDLDGVSAEREEQQK